MLLMSRGPWLGLLIGIASCATPEMTATELAGRAQQNLLAAQRDLAGKSLLVRGTVRGSTLVSTSKIRADLEAPSGAEAYEVRESLPMVLLDPGSVYCYFNADNIDEAAALKQGDQTALNCRVDSFHVAGAAKLAVLADCRRAR